MRIPDDQGRTRLSQLRLFAQRTGKPHPDLTPPTHHVGVAHLWAWFHELDGRRVSGPITYDAIESWCRVRRRQPRQWEIDALLRIDDAVLREINAHERERLKQEARKNDRHRPPRR